ncbi:FMN-binding negative transcriptional regulator [Chitinimonas sp. PSY-7]|uniref:FMN-binding negative transcriptional regulator n=1 Tax=Chitinimonas sp. PSY-7 TaxID=3459088 RepID=UPI0040401C22
MVANPYLIWRTSPPPLHNPRYLYTAMYQPSSFQETRPELLKALIADYPQATVLAVGPNGIEANLLPMMLTHSHQTDRLIGHVAASNPLAKMAGSQVTVLFHGPDAYVSPNWYPSKAQHHKVVPTWNYMVVEGRGVLRTFQDETALKALLDRLTTRFEANQRRPWQLSDAPAEFVSQMMRVIVGIEISLSSLQGKFKLSQNRSAEDFLGTIAGLRATGEAKAMDVANWMKRYYGDAD